jgi:DNA (cytosine-5)-methyltransferase 1
MTRIAKGVDRYVLKAARPFIVSLTHQGGDRTESVDSPAMTLTGANRGEKAIVSPMIAAAQHGGMVRPAHVAVHLTRFNTGAIGSAADEPSPTITANSFVKRPGGAAPLGVVAAYVAQHNGGFNTTPGHPVDDPASTISSKGSQQQLVGCTAVPYYGSEDDGCGVTEPARTVTTRDHFGIAPCIGSPFPLTPEQEAGARIVAAFLREHGVEFEGEFATITVRGELFVIVDIGMRMLRPRELYNAQSFPLNYIIDRGLDEDEKTGRIFEIALTGTDQVRMCGNSVCPIMAEVIVGANNPEMRMEEAAA